MYSNVLDQKRVQQNPYNHVNTSSAELDYVYIEHSGRFKYKKQGPIPVLFLPM